jgi:hypothetical protein
MKISSLDYEIFTQALHQHLINKDGLDGVNVQHNVILKGKSGATYQIDVAWSICVANVTQWFCVECKHWKSRVKKENISSFLGNLLDLGNARGIYVTTMGYQRGALQLAKERGVILIEANYEPKKYPATLTVSIPQRNNCIISIEKELNFREQKIWQQSLKNSNPPVVDKTGAAVCSLNDLVSQYDHEFDGTYTQHPEDCYLESRWGLVRIAEVKYDYKSNVIPELNLYGEYEMADVVAKYILDNHEVRATLPSHR